MISVKVSMCVYKANKTSGIRKNIISGIPCIIITSKARVVNWFEYLKDYRLIKESC